MEGVGIRLKRARESCGLELSTIAYDLKIRPQYLAALENNIHTNNDVYTLGYLKLYANYLSVDVDQYIKKIKKTTNTEFYSIEKVITEQSKPPFLTIVVAVLCLVFSVILLRALNHTSFPKNATMTQQGQLAEFSSSAQLFLVGKNKFILENTSESKPLIILLAQADSNIIIEDNRGENLQKFHLKQGESRVLPTSEYLVIIVDMPNATEFYEFSSVTMSRKKLAAK